MPANFLCLSRSARHQKLSTTLQPTQYTKNTAVIKSLERQESSVQGPVDFPRKAQKDTPLSPYEKGLASCLIFHSQQ